MAAPWYSFPRIDNFGQRDPQGDYWKPDSNVLTPSGYPVTALLPGTVTSVRRTSWGQQVVTIKLDTPINGLATHTFFEHMHDATVAPGQRVSAGTLIGHANYSGDGANLGFGFYSGDVYGDGSAWDVLQKDLAPGGKGLLNPTKVLDAAKSGGTIPLTSSSNVPNFLDPGGAVSGIMATVKIWGEYIAVFILALLLIVMGLVLLAGNPAQAAKKVIG